jgi:uncharacterized protein
MSKPEATSAKSLEEIIASIRKSLSGDGPGSRAATSRPARVEPELAPPAQAPEPGDGLLTDRLAGALNGAANGTALDDDLSDILAQETKSPAPAKPVAAKPFDGDGERRDPPWFRSASTTPANGLVDAAGRGPAGEVAPAPSSEPVTLSRPEVLRASLPPLFGEESEHALPARTSVEGSKPADKGVLKARTQPPPSSPRDADETVKPAVGGMFSARTHPSVLPPQPQPAGSIDKSPTVGEARTGMLASLQAFETSMPAASSAPIANPLIFDEGAPEMPLAAEPAIASEMQPAPVAEVEPAVAPPAEIESEADAVAGEIKADAIAKAVPSALNGAAAAKPAPAFAPPARSLEQVVGELLEPVIRHWLENNLPRMVEKVVREEVARTIAADRAAPKATD